jgi:DNA end-binding protein Ku
MAEEREARAERDAAPAPRAFWSGTLTFGLVSVPVDLFPAVRARRVALRTLGPDDQPLVRRYFCSADGEALTNDDIVRGYENDDGSFTVVADEELEALAPRKSRDIDLRRFVKREEIPRQLLGRPYVLAPAGESTKAYHLLAETMQRAGKAGIATFVMRGKEYLAAIFAEGGTLRAVTMRFAAELRTPDEVGLPSVARAPADRRQEMERALAELTEDELDLKLLEDEYADALLELAEAKRDAGRDVVEIEEAPAEDDEDSADVIDIMAVLKERMGGAERKPARAQPARAAPARADRAPASRAPGHDALEGKSKKELYEQAKKLGLEGRSSMSREQLIAALRKAG